MSARENDPDEKDFVDAMTTYAARPSRDVEVKINHEWVLHEPQDLSPV